jgi:hypothetical protein
MTPTHAHRRTQITANWLRWLLGVLGAVALLMAVSAAPIATIITGLIAGAALITAAAMATPGRRGLVTILVAAALPFAILAWWAVVPPLVVVVALLIGLAATRAAPHSDEPTIAVDADVLLRRG